MTDNRKKDIRNRIKEIVKHIWVNEIKRDYEKYMLIGEDTLKNVFFFHLRNYLKYEIEKDNLRIYTEYYVKDAKSKADILIGYLNDKTMKMLDETREYYCTKEAVEPLAIFELKYKSYSGGENDFCLDISKVKERYKNVTELENCDFYLCFISEYDFGCHKWSDDERITELTACYNSDSKEMKWYPKD